MPKRETGNRLLDVGEVARQLNLLRMSIYNGPLRHSLPWIRLGNRRLRMRQSDLDNYLREHQEDSAA